MSSKHSSSLPQTVAVVAFEGISLFHLAVPCMIFGEDRDGLPRYRLLVCSCEGRPLRSSVGLRIDALQGLAPLLCADIVIVPSWRDALDPAPPALLRALRAAHARGACIVGLCLGAFVLAQAGLLDGRRASTHWAWAEEFARRFPAVQMQSEALYVDEGDVITSAGTAAALDCCLHLLRRDHGAAAANSLARRLVVAPHRMGGQAQFVQQAVPEHARDERMAKLLDWLLKHLEQQHGVDALAQRVLMSRRTFTRQFRAATGTTAVQWLLTQRLQLAQTLLEAGQLSVEQIALRVGFGSALSLRQHFNARFGLSPSAWRRQFLT